MGGGGEEGTGKGDFLWLFQTRKKGVKETEEEKSSGYFVEADSILTAVVYVVIGQ